MQTTFKTLFLVIALFLVTAIHAETFTFTGIVTNQTTKTPVENHDVKISALKFSFTGEDSIQTTLLKTIQTNQEGVFTTDLLFDEENKYYIVSTLDPCSNYEWTRIVTTVNVDMVMNFETCFPETETSFCYAYFYTYTDSISPLTIHFSDRSEGSIKEWIWDFGDGTTSSKQDPTHTFAEKGTYTVSLTAKTQNLEDTYTYNVYVGESETYNPSEEIDSSWVYFYAFTDSAENELTVQFQEHTNMQNASIHWNFGDGNTSIKNQPQHTYNEEGTYNVTLTVSNDDEEQSYSQEITVPFIYEDYDNNIYEDTTHTYVYFGYYSDSTENELQINFYNYSYGEFSNFNWNFGDGTSSTEENPQHIYNEEGTYNVTLTVSNDDEEQSYNQEITVPFIYEDYNEIDDDSINNEEENLALEVHFSYYTDSTQVNTIYFYDLSQGDIESWEWDFGDETTSSDQYPSHTYEKDGVYNTTLTISNKDDSKSYSQEITIKTSESNKSQQSSASTNRAAATFKAYPTNVENTITLEFANQANILTDITIYSTSGKTVFRNQIDISSTSTVLDLSYLQKGNYIIVIDHNTLHQTVRFRKK